MNSEQEVILEIDDDEPECRLIGCIGLGRRHKRHHHHHPEATVVWRVPFLRLRISPQYPPTQRPQEVRFIMSDFTLRDSDPDFSVALTLDDVADQVTTPDSPPVWASSDSTIVALVSASSDGMSATFHPVAPGGVTISSSTTDTNGTVVVASGTVAVEAGEAVKGTLTFTAGTAPAPVPAPAPAPATPAASTTPDPVPSAPVDSTTAPVTGTTSTPPSVPAS